MPSPPPSIPSGTTANGERWFCGHYLGKQEYVGASGSYVYDKLPSSSDTIKATLPKQQTVERDWHRQYLHDNATDFIHAEWTYGIALTTLSLVPYPRAA